MFSFQIKTRYQNARTGVLKTPHGNIKTPAFIFCGTKAAIKGLPSWEVKNAKTQIILSNTYHLMINPGPDLIKSQGGIHKFMNWSGPILTDSGGFQIFSMGHGSVSNEIKGKRNNKIKSCVKISENGAEFRSYFDGKKYYLTPEKSVEIQQKLGVDFIVMFDECTPFHVDKIYTKKSMDLTHRWGIRSINQYKKGDMQKQKLYGIVQGGIYMDLRNEAINFVNNKEEFFGIAIGGSLGKDKSQMNDIVSYTTERIDKKRPCHLLGIGGIEDIINGSMKGIDTFDCVHPTRLARHGGAIVRKALRDSKKEHINLRNLRYKTDNTPIDPECKCNTCQNFSKSYLNYLMKAKELLYVQLISIHNIYTINTLMDDIRSGIDQNDMSNVKAKWL